MCGCTVERLQVSNVEIDSSTVSGGMFLGYNGRVGMEFSLKARSRQGSQKICSGNRSHFQ